MSENFLQLLNMSITAGWIVLAVLLVRLIFPKLPKYIRCLLWSVVGIRLVMPVSVESIFSLIPSAQTISPDIITQNSFDINTGFTRIDTPLNDYLGDHYYEGVTIPTNTGLNLMQILSVIWLAGVAAMLVYATINYMNLRRKVKISLPYAEHAYLCDNISTPFILGIFKPRIYLPSHLTQTQITHILAHENAHLARKDHLFKPLGFLLLSVYWFNPILWFAYILFCRDIELACDEKVVQNMSIEDKKAYSTTLLACSIKQHRLISVCPLAFGEIGVKVRVKSILNYKKPAFWVIITAVVLCIIMTVCFLTNPVDSKKVKTDITGKKWFITTVQKQDTGEIIACDADYLTQHKNASMADLTLTADADTLTIYDNLNQKKYAFGYHLDEKNKLSTLYQLTSKQTKKTGIANFSTTTYADGKSEYTLLLTLENYTLNFTEKPSVIYNPKTDMLTYECYQPDSLYAPVRPALYLSLTDNRFKFVYSETDRIEGIYQRKDGKLILTTIDGQDSYQFEIIENAIKRENSIFRYDCLKFDAEHSSQVPKCTVNDVTYRPLKGQLEFYGTMSIIEDMENFKNLQIGEEEADIDGDGIKEQCTFRIANTTKPFSFVFIAAQNGKIKYENTFESKVCVAFKLVETKKGCQLHLLDHKNSKAHTIYDISIKDGNIALTEVKS